MAPQTDFPKLSVGQFAGRFRQEMIPLGNTFSYFPATPLIEEEIKEYLEDPIRALPQRIRETLPKVCVFLVPYLERPNGKDKTSCRTDDMVCFEKPPAGRQRWQTSITIEDEAVLAFAIKDQEVADYHHSFYSCLAALISDRWDEDTRTLFLATLREELGSKIHGEVDEASWKLKQGLLRRQTNVRRDTKLFREYARQAFIDTLALYLHGICCDIDVEPGPRQLPSRHVRKRLQLLHDAYSPPEGYAVFPEDAEPE